jgi:galactose-1-phosphate uridylyltransferase
MNKLVSNVCAFIYFQVTQLIYDCMEIKFPSYFFVLLLQSSRCEKVATIVFSLVRRFGKSRNCNVKYTTMFQQTHKSFDEIDQEVVSTILYPILVITKFVNLRKQRL